METSTAFSSGLVLIFAAIFLVTKRVLLQTKTPKLKLPPTIRWAIPLIGHLHLFKKPIHRTLGRLSSLHGPLLLLRLGAQPVILVSSPDIAEECFTHNDVVFANRPYNERGKYLTYDYTTITSAPYGPHWRNLRRLTNQEIFSTTRLTALSYLRVNEARSLVRDLFRAPMNPGFEGFRRVELKPKIKELLLNIIMQMINGKRYVGEGAAADPEESRRFLDLVDETFRLSSVTSVADVFPFARWLGLGRGHIKRLVNLQKEMDGLLQEMVDERRRRRQPGEATQGEGRKDLLDVMLSLQESDADYYTDKVIKGVIKVLIAASTETTSGTLEWAMSLLLNNPEALKKLRGEINNQVGNKQLVVDSDLPKLPYLTNVIKETLRLFPAVPLLVPHQSSNECKIRGYDIPSGTVLFVNVFAINRDPTLWTEPTKFKPERFEVGEGQRYNFIPFGSGRRRCPGDVLATRIIELTLGTLIQCFEWKRVGDMEVDLTEAGAINMFKAITLQAMYKPHEDMINILSQL